MEKSEKRIERAKEKIGGYYWDKVSTPKGIGYMAREAKDGSKTYLVVPKKYEISGDYIIVVPGATVANIEGATNTSNVFGTGAQIKLEGKTYTLVMLGDVNGDGKVKSTDYVLIKNYIMDANTSKLNNQQLKAADVNKDGKINKLLSNCDKVKIDGKPIVKYRIWQYETKKMTYFTINLNNSYKQGKKVFLHKIVSEDVGVKFFAEMMKRVVDVAIENPPKSKIGIMSQVYIPSAMGKASQL